MPSRKLLGAAIALVGIVVGLLGAALYDPVFTTAVHGHADFVIALACFVLLVSWKMPPLFVVALRSVAGVVAATMGGG